MKAGTFVNLLFVLTMIASMAGAISANVAPAAAAPTFTPPTPVFSNAVAFDTSPALRDLPPRAAMPLAPANPSAEPLDIRPDRGPVFQDKGFSGDGALQSNATPRAAIQAPAIAAPTVNFEGVSSLDNFNVFGFRVNPPDPMGDVGPNNYVEMINLTLSIFDKQGNRLAGPTAIGDLWAGFAMNDCTDPSGDPVVLYDQLVDRWILSQFTTRGPKYYDCVAISKTGDPTGAYYRYAFVTQPDPELPGGTFFPDYPKYGV